MKNRDSIHIKYLIANELDLLWPLAINTVGCQHIDANAVYPPTNHPTRYCFSKEKGRVLNEYQLLYITEGEGDFTSASQKNVRVRAGNMFLLFPGEWHNYYPNKSTGWTEYWIGFEGKSMDERIKNGFFSKQKPIFNVGYSDELIPLYSQAITVAQAQKTGFQQLLAGIVEHLLGIAYSHNKFSSFEDMNVTNHIARSKIFMLENFHKSMSIENISDHIGISYSWFRRIFKEYTGFTPHQYLQKLRIQKSKELLTNTIRTSQEIAFEVGFDSPDYFCTAFKKHTGLSPINYRAFTQGRNIPSNNYIK